MRRTTFFLVATLTSASAAADEPAVSPAGVHDASVLGDGYAGPGIPVDLHMPAGEDASPVRLRMNAMGSARGEYVGGFAVDRDLQQHDPGATLNAHLRLGLAFDTGSALGAWIVRAETEHDVPTGVVGPAQTLEGLDYPGVGGAEYELRKAYVGVALRDQIRLDVGWQTSHWGLGLLANDGAHGWEPGSAAFSDPRSGDRVARLRLMTGPHQTAGLLAVFAADVLDGEFYSDDDVLLEGDTAIQLVSALRLGDRENFGGLYVAYRRQRALGPLGEERDTEVVALDANVRGSIGDARAFFTIEGEAALIVGTTQLAPSVDFPVHDVTQFGAAIRMTAGAPVLGAVFDFLYASGDQNLDDEQQNAFKADPNHEMGLMLFRHVVAAQTARAQHTAGDPSLVGVPADNLERLPTRGSVTNTIAFFPRLRARPVDGLEVYGGPLVALTAVPVADPLNTRVNGGAPSSPLGGPSGSVLGVELDVGARYRVNLGGPELTLGVEAGALQPGNALRDLELLHMDWIFGGRTMLDVRL
jgi:hypothetical protein